MKILLLAPNPFYQERGTPIAIDLLLGALSERGDQVDVLTYHLGADRAYPGVAIHRIPRVPLVRAVRPGLSPAKLACDAVMTPRAVALARRGGYDLVHAVEESVFMARLLRRLYGLPYVYDMDSSMPQQIVEKSPGLRVLLPLMGGLERGAARNAEAVIAVCDSLADAARRAGARQVFILRDVSLLGAPPPPPRPAGPLTFLYVGNLEPYQGIDLLLESFGLAARTVPTLRLVVVGGPAADVERYRQKARALAPAAAVDFRGPRPVSEMAALFAEAHVLVSPRTKGVNTPMKIYSYLDSGRPILATDLFTHTQVLTPDTALLAQPEAKPFADAMCRLASDAALRAALAGRAGELARAVYSTSAFRRNALAIYAAIEEGVRSRRAAAGRT